MNQAATRVQAFSFLSVAYDANPKKNPWKNLRKNPHPPPHMEIKRINAGLKYSLLL